MRIKTPHYYENFQCIASACADSCCAGWEVDIDDASYAHYSQVEGAFGERLRSVMSQEGEKHFIIRDKRCPFLNGENLCDIYTALGKEGLCETCTNFPRCIEEYGSLREVALSMACPEVTRLMLTSGEHISFRVREDGQPLTRYNDIHAELYLTLTQSRGVVYHILKREEYNPAQKLVLILCFGEELEKHMHRENCRKMEKINQRYEQSEELDGKLEQMRKESRAVNRSACFEKYLELLQNCECISQKWQHMLAAARNRLEQCEECLGGFNDLMKERQAEYEYFLENLTYRYFLRGVLDGKIIDKVRLLAFSYLLLKELNAARWLEQKGEFTLLDQMLLMQTFSKEIEHSDDNMALLWEKFTQDDGFFNEVMVSMLLQEPETKKDKG